MFNSYESAVRVWVQIPALLLTGCTNFSDFLSFSVHLSSTENGNDNGIYITELLEGLKNKLLEQWWECGKCLVNADDYYDDTYRTKGKGSENEPALLVLVCLLAKLWSCTSLSGTNYPGLLFLYYIVAFPVLPSNSCSHFKWRGVENILPTYYHWKTHQTSIISPKNNQRQIKQKHLQTTASLTEPIISPFSYSW